MSVDGVDVARLSLHAFCGRIGKELLGCVGSGCTDVDAGRRVEWAALFIEMSVRKVGRLCGIEVLDLVLEEFPNVRGQLA